MAERPHPRQMSSNKVEHTAMQGESVAVKTRFVGVTGAGCTGVATSDDGGVEGMCQE